LVELHWWQ
jgi:hypothetical protein